MERTFVLICFFWAVLTIITPTLIRLSENSKLLDSIGEKSGVKAMPRRMMGLADQKRRPSKAPMHLPLMEAPAPAPAQAPVTAPAPARGLKQELNPALPAKRAISTIPLKEQ